MFSSPMPGHISSSMALSPSVHLPTKSAGFMSVTEDPSRLSYSDAYYALWWMVSLVAEFGHVGSLVSAPEEGIALSTLATP